MAEEEKHDEKKAEAKPSNRQSLRNRHQNGEGAAGEPKPPFLNLLRPASQAGGPCQTQGAPAGTLVESAGRCNQGEVWRASSSKSYSFIGQNQIEVKKDRIVEIMTFLRDNKIAPFTYLADETAVHWPKDEEFELVYILYSFAENEHLRVKTRIKEWEPIESVVAVWSTADWLEREVYDMFGVQYANHPNLKRILLPEDWVGFPLRKDYNIRLQDVEWVRKHLGIDSGTEILRR